MSVLLLLVLVVGEIPAASVVGTAEEKGLAIAQAAAARDVGFVDLTATVDMQLASRGRRVATRSMRVMVLERRSSSDWSLVIVDDPPDLAGTTLLSTARTNHDHDQWLYLPAVRRVKRLSGNHRSGAFLGSEFSFEDIAVQSVDRYRWRLLGEEEIAQHRCWVLERTPVGHSAYRYAKVWLDQEAYRLLQVEYYNLRDELVKTMTLSDYVVLGEDYWRPQTMEMHNHVSGRMTTLRWREYVIGTGIDEGLFNPSMLGHIR